MESIGLVLLPFGAAVFVVPGVFGSDGQPEEGDYEEAGECDVCFLLA